MLVRNQLNGVYGIPQRWASSPTNEDREEVEEERKKRRRKSPNMNHLPNLVNG
jgi:hypothetical protein